MATESASAPTKAPSATPEKPSTTQTIALLMAFLVVGYLGGANLLIRSGMIEGITGLALFIAWVIGMTTAVMSKGIRFLFLTAAVNYLGYTLLPSTGVEGIPSILMSGATALIAVLTFFYGAFFQLFSRN